MPRLQFVLTAHSPLLVGALRPENLVVLEPHREAGGTARPRRIVDDVFGRSADGVLTSSYFDLVSTRADPFRAHLRELLARARKGDRNAPLELMRVLGNPGRAPRGTKREPRRRRR